MILPDGWRATTLGELGLYLNGRGFKKAEWGSTGRPIIRIQNLTGSSAFFNYFDGSVDERNVARYGDLLVSWAATLGAYIWSGPEGLVNQHIFKVQSFIDQRFHKYLLDEKLSELMRRTHGSGMVHVTRRQFDSLPVIVPPLDEQRRIVEILEEHLSSLDEGTDQIALAELRSTRLTDSYLANDATVERAHRINLGSLLEQPLANGRSVKDRDDGFPVLRLSAITGGFFNPSAFKYGAWDAAEAARFVVREQDFLCARGNGSRALVGRGVTVNRIDNAVAYPDTMIRIRIDQARLDNQFFEVVWNSPIARRQIERRAKTTAGIYKVSQVDLAAVEIPLPALAQQRRIADEVSKLRDSADEVQRASAGARTRAAALRRALLGAAFSGQLTGRSSDLDRAEELVS